MKFENNSNRNRFTEGVQTFCYPQIAPPDDNEIGEHKNAI